MNTVNQNSALASLEKALIPGPLLIDGRTERDMLHFLTEFATLINFYDSTNTVNGNWQPFLLKDPVILLAAISKTKYNAYHTLYLNTCAKLEENYGYDIAERPVVATLINQLFDQLTAVFKHIERWTHYMHTSEPDYDLKKYVLAQVKQTYSQYFWAIITLRQKVALLSPMKIVDPAPHHQLESFHNLIWTTNKDKQPYWQVLDPDKAGVEEEPPLDLWDIFIMLSKAGDVIFDFFHIIIRQSVTEFETLKTKKGKYPDTILLRTFVNLLSVHQQQLNDVSQKHLQFYYKDILKQVARPAVADKAYLFATLAKSDNTFKLRANTMLNAGPDAQKNTILFATTQDTELNPAVITSAYTLTKTVTDNMASLYLRSIPNPGAAQKDLNGNITSWETFGSLVQTPDSLVKIGIAFASPMFLLREGNRKITVTLKFITPVDAQMLNGASYYLSTQSRWLSVTPTISPAIGNVSQVVMVFDLNAIQPPIVPYLNNPDGLQSVWPMLKIEFDSFTDLKAGEPIPAIGSIKVDIAVYNVKSLQLYNDFGAISNKTPYPLWGPLPLVNSGFMIGSNEIFSKPVSTLGLEVDWSNLPDDFSAYYNEYNNYIYPPDVKAEQHTSLLGKILWPPNWFKNTDNNDNTGTQTPPLIFGNCSFTAGFKTLQNSSWADVKMSNQMPCVLGDCTMGKCVYQSPASTLTLPGDPIAPTPLFSTSCFNVINPDGKTAQVITHTLNNSSYFIYQGNGPMDCDPNLQLTPLKFTETSTSGFIKMVLSGPNYGFGSEIYPKVVANIATANAINAYRAMEKDNEDKPVIINPANLPFAPKVTQLVANYTASQEYIFTKPAGAYPIECFTYGPFQNSLVYDNTSTSVAGIPLIPKVDYGGELFIGLDNLVPANSINFYFDLSRKYGSISTDNKLQYAYLTDTEWALAEVYSDTTNSLTCSGIVKLSVPWNVSNTNTAMPDKKYWLSIKSDNPGASAATIFITTNGFEAQRSGTTFLTDQVAPLLPSNAITKTQQPIPRIATILQPFPSTGGQPAEDHLHLNQRISNRLNTKDRAVSASDFFRIIKQRYSDIYYSKTVAADGANTVYIVKSAKDSSAPDAFAPIISICREEHITDYLNERAPAFAQVSVANFNFLYLCVTADVVIKPGYGIEGMRKAINDALNLYLSPWITADQDQLIIDQGITGSVVAKFIKSIDGVAQVKKVQFQVNTENSSVTGAALQQSVIPTDPGMLIVSYMEHQISFDQ